MADGPALTVAAPAGIAEHLRGLDEPWLAVVEWDGHGPLPEAASVHVWVPPYGVANDPAWVSRQVSSLPALRVVQLLSAGVEPWPGLVPAGVTLCSGRGIHGGSTAELAVALVLAQVRDLPWYADQQRRGEWRRHAPDEVAGKRVLVLGAGDIGARVARTLGTLDADVTLVARTPRRGVVGLEDMPSLLGSTDVLVVALPHTPETTRLVDRRMLSALPDGALVVNVGRGALLDLEALTEEVAAGRLRAALDVTDPEPLPADHPLWHLAGAMVTPHVGGGASGWQARACRLVEDQLRRVHAGEDLENVVDAGY